MGDYTNSGAKIGTCGNAYYATYKMIMRNKHDGDCSHYANPKNTCTFAFPFPEWDDKEIGEISNFHQDQWIPFYFNFNGESHHKRMVFHSHPQGAPGVNIFAPCPQDRSAPADSVSANMPAHDTFRLSSTAFWDDGNMYIVGTCPYCGGLTLFNPDEAAQIVAGIRARTYRFYSHEAGAYIEDTKQRDYDREIARRIEEIYSWANTAPQQ